MLYSGQARPYRCRFHRARGSSPRPKTARKVTAGVIHHCNNKNSYIPIFFGPQSVSITTSIAAFGGREGNRQSAVLGNILLILLLDWISESRRSFFFPQLLIYFLHSAAPQAHTHTRLMGHLPTLPDLGNGTASTNISSLPLSFQTFAISVARLWGI